MNYEKDIKIDESALDLEWLDQPQLFMKYASHSAEKSMELDLAKEALDLEKAELDRQIREDPERFGIPGKLTETIVTNTIITQPGYKKALKKVNEARFEYEISRAAVSAMHTKKDALENLVRLHGMQYFAGPRMPRDIKAEVERKEQQTKVDAGVGKRLRRTK